MTTKSPFARLFRSAAAKTADEDEAARRKAKRMADQEDADEGETEEEVVDRVADDAEDDLRDTDDDGEDDADAKRKAKKKAKVKAEAKDDDDGDGDDDKDPKTRAARARERGRVAAIMASPAAQANPTAALFVALRTSTSRDAACADIAAMGPAAPAGKSRALSRLAEVDVPDVGQNGETRERSNTRATADAIIAAGKRARGET